MKKVVVFAPSYDVFRQYCETQQIDPFRRATYVNDRMKVAGVRAEDVEYIKFLPGWTINDVCLDEFVTHWIKMMRRDGVPITDGGIY